MRRARFPIRLLEAVSAPPLSGSTLSITDESSLRHLTQVLRLKPGDEIELFDPAIGCAVVAALQSVARDHACALVLGAAPPVEGVPAVLICGMPKSSTADFIVEKCVELGIKALHFFEGSRTQGRLKAENRRARLGRWDRLGQAALKQSGGQTLPEMGIYSGFEEALNRAGLPAGTEGKALLTAPQPGTAISENISRQSPESEQALPLLTLLEHWDESADFFLIIGPEGGLSHEESSLALARGFRPASLGPKVLRTETAAVAACAGVRLEVEARRFKVRFSRPSSA